MIPAVLQLRLYVAGEAPNSVAAIANLRAALAAGPVDLEIIDVVADPARGLLDGIIVTPMLIKLAPLPERRILGNLRDGAVLRAALGLAEVVP